MFTAGGDYDTCACPRRPTARTETAIWQFADLAHAPEYRRLTEHYQRLDVKWNSMGRPQN
jgi:hypothetical protein